MQKSLLIEYKSLEFIAQNPIKYFPGLIPLELVELLRGWKTLEECDPSYLIITRS